MAFDPDLLELMSTTAQYEQFVANNIYGEPSFLAPTTFLCHVTYRRKIIRSNSEEDRTSTAQLQVPPPGYVTDDGSTTPTLTIYDRIVLPYDGIERKVIDLDTYTDGDAGVHHQSVSLE